MNDQPEPPTTKPKSKRKKSTPRAPRTIDPEVAALRAQHKEAVKQLHRARASSGVLKRIQALVPKLTDIHLAILSAEIRNFDSPPHRESYGPAGG